MKNKIGMFNNCINRFLYVNYQESCDNLFKGTSRWIKVFCVGVDSWIFLAVKVKIM